MAWRFKASKYKNAAPIVPKPEACIRDVCVGSYQTHGNNITASAAFMAFNWEHTGSVVAVLPLDDCGRKSKTMPLVYAHTDTVTDLCFSPFHDGLLSTASQDCTVKIWHIPEKGLETSLTEPECTFTHKQKRVETVGFHPTADGLLYSTAAGCVTLYDLIQQKEIFGNNEHPDVIQSASWKQDGTLLATSCKDKYVRIMDARAATNPIQMTAESHQNIKDSRVVWLGNQTRILTTGFDVARLREVIIRDLRNFAIPEKTMQLDCSTGILMPLFDADTNMLFLAGKGDTTINYLEVIDKEPYLIEGLRHTGEQTKGACLIPKRALKVMEGEVNRILQLTSNMVIPIMYQVPRKTYRDFHNDLYPDTSSYHTELSAAQWINGINIPLAKMSLDPTKRELGDNPIIIHRGNFQEYVNNIANKKLTVNDMNSSSNNKNYVNGGSVGDMQESVIMKGMKNYHHQQQQQQQQQQLQKDENNVEVFQNELKSSLRNINDCKYKTDSEKEQKRIVDGTQQHNISMDETSCNLDNSNNNIHNIVNDNDHGNGNVNGSIPTPMPRTSRKNSLADTITMPSSNFREPNLNVNVHIQGNVSNNSNVNVVPRPRPRTTAGTTYKCMNVSLCVRLCKRVCGAPRLGPKPFSSNTVVDVVFDKVFSVPVAPGSQENIAQISHTTNYAIDMSDTSTVKPNLIVEIEIKNNDNGIRAESENNVEKKTLSTSERRKSSVDDDDSSEKIFEQNNSESSENSTEGDDKADAELRRFSPSRNSIAERRRVYEMHSKSANDERSQSPVSLRREIQPKVDIAQHKTGVGNIDVKRTSVPEGKMLEEKRRNLSTKDMSVVDNSNTVGLKKSVTEAAVICTTKRTSTVFGKVSKFRHLKGTPGHKSTHIENLRNICGQIPGECNGFTANHERVAVPLSGPGGKIAIFEINRPGRLPDGVIPSLVNGNKIMDFQWDPFDTKRLAVACDDGIVKFWHIPEGGLNEPTNVAQMELTAHSDKIYFIRFHPFAQDVLLTASYDRTVKVWDLCKKEKKCTLIGHADQIFDFAWSPCGKFGATVCKDGKIRIFDPRKSEKSILEGNGPVGTRGARIVWALDGQYIVCTGFDKVSERQISVYKSDNLKTPLNIASLDVSPSILIPFYDEDSSTLFVMGKGDSTIYCFEITDEDPYICPLSHHRCTSLHQGLSFLTKNHCDVASVEFCKAYRLTNTTIEPLSFTVPRIKSGLFQDDLFPPTRVTWLPTMSANEWFQGNNRTPNKISLQPEGMDTLSSTQSSTLTSQTKRLENITNSNVNFCGGDSVINKEKQIQKSVSSRMAYHTTLEQDNMEGVDESEWQD